MLEAIAVVATSPYSVFETHQPHRAGERVQPDPGAHPDDGDHRALEVEPTDGDLPARAVARLPMARHHRT